MLYQAVVRERKTIYYVCTVDAENKIEAALKLEAGMDGAKTTYPFPSGHVYGNRTVCDIQELVNQPEKG